MTNAQTLSVALFCGVALSIALPASAQLGKLGQLGDKVQKAKEVKDRVDDLHFTEAEEQQLGSQISEMLRQKYGVVQDTAVHKYVTLVGSNLAQSSSRPNLSWTFIVLDTDGVNAFAAPGGFIHVTRGALALMQNEAELAGVLGHEITHVTAKHTISAIQKARGVAAVASATRNGLISQVANKGYEVVLENNFDRKEEMEADSTGVILASKAGYAPTALGAFLTRLADRNKDLKDPSGIFASHPETKARMDGLAKVIAAEKLAGTATVQTRFRQTIVYTPVPVAQIATASDGSTPAATKAADPKPGGGKFGLSGLSSLGKEKSSTQTVSSAGSRGVNPDRDANGGPNKSLVVVTVTAAELADFRKGIV
jgi:beta-barrel assembly-enhancing protease